MTSPISSSTNLNSVQLFSAVNAFKSSMTSPIKPQASEIEVSEGTNLDDDFILKTKDVEDIRKYANMMGENLNEDDIKYGLSYGRSVIVEYSA